MWKSKNKLKKEDLKVSGELLLDYIEKLILKNEKLKQSFEDQEAVYKAKLNDLELENKEFRERNYKLSIEMLGLRIEKRKLNEDN